MPKSFDGCEVPEVIQIPCGEAHWDHGSECSYRCWNCMATLGSIAMPDRCKRLMEQNVTSEEELVKKNLGFPYTKFKEKDEDTHF